MKIRAQKYLSLLALALILSLFAVGGIVAIFLGGVSADAAPRSVVGELAASEVSTKVAADSEVFITESYSVATNVINYNAIRESSFAHIDEDSVFTEVSADLEWDTATSVAPSGNGSTKENRVAKDKTKEKSSGISITLTYKHMVFNYDDRYISPDNHLIAGELHLKKINGSYAQKMEIMNKCLAAGSTYKNAVLFTMPRLSEMVDTAIKEIYKPPQNSKIDFKPDETPMFRIKREVSGVRVREEDLYRSIYAALKLRPCINIGVKTESITPEITADDNAKLTKLRARHSTELGRSSDNRKENISLALRKVNGTVLQEGEEFSFNRTVGRRTEANGFKESKIIVGGKYEDGVGGGVCQASTTLYNAALLAGLSVTSARNHSLECSYELPSFDAMVNHGSSDLRFKNSDKTPVFIKCYCTETSVVFEVYGSLLDYRIERKSEVVYRKPPPAPQTVVDTEHKYFAEGTESGTQRIVSSPRGEMKSVGFLLYYDKAGRLIKTEKIREDVYSAVKGLVAVAP